MHQLLKLGTSVKSTSGHLCTVKTFLGGGGQGQPWAAVQRHPQQPDVWGLKNLSSVKWVSTAPDGTIRDVEPGRSVSLATGVKVNFGSVEGEIRF